MYVHKCRICGSSKLRLFLDLGETPPADQFIFRDQFELKSAAFPLQVVNCQDCGLIQLNYIVPPELLYCDDYPYESSTTRAGREHWREFAGTVSRRLGLTAQDLVVDIGSNVGVLLQSFRECGTRVLGIDPAANIVEIAIRNGIPTREAFFGAEVARTIRGESGPAMVLTGTNVFAHIHDLDDAMRGVDALLADRGVFIIEAPFVVNLINGLEYDTIYHEHLSYLSVQPLQRLFSRYGMEIFDIQLRDIHGGSFRVFVQRRSKGGRPVEGIVDDLLREERAAGIYDNDRLDRFARDVAHHRETLLSLLGRLKSAGKRIAAVSAPAKGMTLLNYCGIGCQYLDFVTEKSQLKIGRYTPGVHIPVVPDSALKDGDVDYALLLAWNFAEEIMRNLKFFSDQGGKFIIPLPNPTIVG